MRLMPETGFRSRYRTLGQPSLTQVKGCYGKGCEQAVLQPRHGPTDTVALQFKADVTRFANVADEERLPEMPLQASFGVRAVAPRQNIDGADASPMTTGMDRP